MRTRSQITIWSVEGSYYAIPEEESPAANLLHQWATLVRAQKTSTTVPAGTVVRDLEELGGVLVRCTLLNIQVVTSRSSIGDEAREEPQKEPWKS
jgi:hypothetical protein